MSIDNVIWDIEPHTEAKLEILRKYLNAWIPILSTFNGRILYIDGFSGPGEYKGGKEGSPLVAIKAFKEQRKPIKNEVKMIFIEERKDRCDYLNSKIQQIEIPKNLIINIHCEKFENVLNGILEILEKNRVYLAPCFIFIDPFGFSDIPFEIIKKIMKNPKCEVLINFMYEEINRFISDPKLWDTFTETFGTEKWKSILELKNPSKEERENLLLGIYKEQLETDAKIRHVNAFKMINKNNRTDYFLFFGTNDYTGLKKMKEAMWKVDNSGSFTFSDATYNPDQPTLFENEPNFTDLKKRIIGEFKGKTVSEKQLEEFVVIKTPYRETHFKTQILRLMEKTLPPEIEVIDRKKRFTYPEGCKIKFL